MAEPLTAQHGPEIPQRIAAMIERVHPAFASRAFVAQALEGCEALGLLPRARHVARAMAAHLPPAYPQALDVVLRSLGPPAAATMGNGIASFVYLPHVYWVAEHGLDHLEPSVAAMHAITQRFSFRPRLPWAPLHHLNV